MKNDHLTARKQALQQCRQIVVKVGTRLLTDSGRIPVLISQIAKLREQGYRVILVSSGAVGLGMKTMELARRPIRLSEVQALAAIGQSKLMSLYEAECSRYGFHAAQLLLTSEDLSDRERHLNVLNCINSLWAQNVLPIINENDSVSVEALTFGDNDLLAAMVATMARCELTVILTTVDGLHSKVNGELGERISLVSDLTDDLRSLATGTDDAALSIGGMKSKLNAADLVTTAGEHLWVTDGRPGDALLKVAAGEDVGTLFTPNSKQMQSRKRWIGFFSESTGSLTVDSGAVKALQQKGRSLLPSGVTTINGSFGRGDTVDVCDQDGTVIARGLSNYSSDECDVIKGQQSTEIPQLLKHAADDEVIHRDNLVLV